MKENNFVLFGTILDQKLKFWQEEYRCKIKKKKRLIFYFHVSFLSFPWIWEKVKFSTVYYSLTQKV